MDKRKFKFYMTDDDGQEFSFEETVNFYDDDNDNELYSILEEFKNFLKAVGYSEQTISHIQWLGDDKWKYVLTSYHEWNSECERFYKVKKEYDNKKV